MMIVALPNGKTRIQAACANSFPRPLKCLQMAPSMSTTHAAPEEAFSWVVDYDRQGGRSILFPPHILSFLLDLILGFACNNVHASEGKDFRICLQIFVSSLSHYSRTIETFSARPQSWLRYVHMITFLGHTPRHSANEHLQPNLHCCSTMNSRRKDGGHCLSLCISKLVIRFLYI